MLRVHHVLPRLIIVHHGYRGMKDSDNQLQKCWDTPMEKRPFSLQIALGHRSVKYNTDVPPPSHVVPLSFEYGLVLLATLIRGGGGITSRRSWTGHLCQNTVQCLKCFCNWLSSLLHFLTYLAVHKPKFALVQDEVLCGQKSQCSG